MPTHEDFEIVTHDGLNLRAILSKPNSSRARVLLLSGSGNVGAGGDVSSPFVGGPLRGQLAHLNEQFAQALMKKGFASLRYDKRGFTDPNQVATQTLPNLLADAEAALALLHKTVPDLPTFILGFSEGALLATLLAPLAKPSAVFLLAPPTRSHPEALRYQFVDWPMRVLKSLDPNDNGWLVKDSLYGADIPYMPLGDFDPVLASFGLTLPSVETLRLPFDGEGRLFFSTIKALYEERWKMISALLQAPFMKALYESYLALPPFSELAAKVTAPVHVYYGTKDSQIDPAWMAADAKAFPRLEKTAAFVNYGHCFAPMEGVIGQTKISGPISDDVLDAIVADVERACLIEG